MGPRSHTFGGPVPHAAKLFFFADYQGTRQTQGIDTGLIAVPSLADRTGDLFDPAAPLTGTVSGGSFAQLLSSRLGCRPTGRAVLHGRLHGGDLRLP